MWYDMPEHHCIFEGMPGSQDPEPLPEGVLGNLGPFLLRYLWVETCLQVTLGS
jgi:hypothetical protein